jgi:hypothetical protein
MTFVLRPTDDFQTLYTVNKDVVEPFPDSSFLLGPALKKTYEEIERQTTKKEIDK